MKTSYIDIRIAATCDKCSFQGWVNHHPSCFSRGHWHCGLFDKSCEGIFPIHDYTDRNKVEPCGECRALVRRYEELPEVDNG